MKYLPTSCPRDLATAWRRRKIPARVKNAYKGQTLLTEGLQLKSRSRNLWKNAKVSKFKISTATCWEMHRTTLIDKLPHINWYPFCNNALDVSMYVWNPSKMPWQLCHSPCCWVEQAPPMVNKNEAYGQQERGLKTRISNETRYSMSFCSGVVMSLNIQTEVLPTICSKIGLAHQDNSSDIQSRQIAGAQQRDSIHDCASWRWHSQRSCKCFATSRPCRHSHSKTSDWSQWNYRPCIEYWNFSREATTMTNHSRGGAAAHTIQYIVVIWTSWAWQVCDFPLCGL